LQGIDARLNVLQTKLRGDRTKARLEEPTSPSIRSRVEEIVGDQWDVTSAPTKTQRDAYDYASDEFREALGQLRELIEKDLAELERKLEAAGAPWTPGRLPTWEKE